VLDPRMLSRLIVVNEVSSAALRHPAAAEICRVVADSIRANFSYLEASVFEVRPAEGEVVLVAQAPPREERREPTYRQPIDAGLVGAAIRERRSILVNDVASDPRYIRPPGSEAAGASELTVPVLTNGQVSAVLDVECREARAFGDGDRLALEAIANVVGLALEAAEAHERLERQVKELAEAQCQILHSERLADIGRLTSRVAHELRNPLTTIGGFARRIAERPDDAEKSRKHAEIIVSEVARLERLLAGVMDFTRPATSQIAPADLNAIVVRALAACAGEVQGHAIVIDQQLSPDLPPIHVDARQIEHAVINVLKNAFDAVADGGSVTILTQRADDSVVLRVSDTGAGIAVDDLERVFGPFFTTKPGHAGLGLSVASQIIEEQGGRLVLGSETGKGTHVNIRLPVGKPTEKESGQ